MRQVMQESRQGGSRKGMFKFYCVLSLESKNYCANSETARSPGEKMCPSPPALGTVALLFRLFFHFRQCL